MKLLSRGGLGLSRLVFGRLFDQTTNRVRRLGAFANPVLHAIRLQVNLGRFASRIIGTEILEIRAVALRLLLLNYDAIGRALLGAGPH